MKVRTLFLAIFLGTIFLTTIPDCLVISGNAEEMPPKSLELYQKMWHYRLGEIPAWIELNNVSKHLWLKPGPRTMRFNYDIVHKIVAIRDGSASAGCTCELATKEKRIELIWRLINEICLLQERTTQKNLVYTSFCTGVADLDYLVLNAIANLGIFTKIEVNLIDRVFDKDVYKSKLDERHRRTEAIRELIIDPPSFLTKVELNLYTTENSYLRSIAAGEAHKSDVLLMVDPGYSESYTVKPLEDGNTLAFYSSDNAYCAKLLAYVPPILPVKFYYNAKIEDTKGDIARLYVKPPDGPPIFPVIWDDSRSEMRIDHAKLPEYNRILGKKHDLVAIPSTDAHIAFQRLVRYATKKNTIVFVLDLDEIEDFSGDRRSEYLTKDTVSDINKRKYKDHFNKLDLSYPELTPPEEVLAVIEEEGGEGEAPAAAAAAAL
jgi:hypothetical protein